VRFPDFAKDFGSLAITISFSIIYIYIIHNYKGRGAATSSTCSERYSIFQSHSIYFPSYNNKVLSAMDVIPKRPVTKLHPELQERLRSVRAKRNFDPQQWIDERVNQLLVYLKVHKLKSCVVSVSGGVDSATVAGLLKVAQDKATTIPDHPFNPANGGKIYCIAQPIDSTKAVQDRAYEVGDVFGLQICTIDRSDEFNTSMDKVEIALGESLKPFAKAMCKSYERTPINYLVAAHSGGVVIGTGNKDEDAYLFYYCKFGDGAVDIGLIWDLHKHEVFQVGAELGVPNSILSAAPSADLSPGQTDEEEIGATYDSVELITEYMQLDANGRISLLKGLSEEACDQFYAEWQLVEEIHRRGQHKADLNPKNIGSGWYQSKFPDPHQALEVLSKVTETAASAASAALADSESAMVSMSLADVDVVMEYMNWSQVRQRNFLTHFEEDNHHRREFERRVALVSAIKER
jgi:NAD+ synthetase